MNAEELEAASIISMRLDIESLENALANLENEKNYPGKESTKKVLNRAIELIAGDMENET